MPYVSGGQLVDDRSPWRLSVISETFWGIINFIVLFFQTMINPDANSKGSGYSSDYRKPGGNGPFDGPGGPRRRMGGFRGGGGGPSPPPMMGGG